MGMAEVCDVTVNATFLSLKHNTVCEVSFQLIKNLKRCPKSEIFIELTCIFSSPEPKAHR